jgi:hypothetical protein
MHAIRGARAVTCIAFASTLCVSAPALSGSGDYFIKIKDLPAAGKDGDHREEIEILSWSFGATQPSASVSKVEGIAIKQKVGISAANDRLRNAGPRNDWPGAKPTLPPTVTLKRGSGAAAAGGVKVAAGDVNGDGATGSGVPTGKRHHKPIMLGGPGSVTLAGNFAGCRVGASYPELELGGGGASYQLTDAVITSCGTAGGDRPVESISLNFTKVE